MSWIYPEYSSEQAYNSCYIKTTTIFPCYNCGKPKSTDRWHICVASYL